MKTSLKFLLGITLLAGLSACPSGEGEKPTGDAGHSAAPAGDASAAPAADASAAPAGDASAAPAASASAAH